MTRATSLVAKIQERLGLQAVVEPGRTGQFDVYAEDSRIASRGGNVLTRVLLGAGFPDLDDIVTELANRQAGSGG